MYRSLPLCTTTTCTSTRALQLDTAGRVGNVRPWVTNEFEHDGLRLSDRVFTHLTDMVRSVGGGV